ncbi:MAG: ATP synthase subunit I [Pseudomonadota bacterium]
MFYAWAAQAAVISLATVVAWSGWGAAPWPMLYGGLVSLANAGLLVWRWSKGVTQFHSDGQRHLRSFHRSMLERFFVVVMLLAAGFAVGLFDAAFRPLPMLIGFIVGQLAWVIAAAALRTN